jgi:hypothetical protein
MAFNETLRALLVEWVELSDMKSIVSSGILNANEVVEEVRHRLYSGNLHRARCIDWILNSGFKFPETEVDTGYCFLYAIKELVAKVEIGDVVSILWDPDYTKNIVNGFKSIWFPVMESIDLQYTLSLGCVTNSYDLKIFNIESKGAMHHLCKGNKTIWECINPLQRTDEIGAEDDEIQCYPTHGFSRNEEKAIMDHFRKKLEFSKDLNSAKRDLSGLSSWTISRLGAVGVRRFIESKLFEIAGGLTSKDKKKLTKPQRQLLQYVKLSPPSFESLSTLSFTGLNKSQISLESKGSIMTISKNGSTISIHKSDKSNEIDNMVIDVGEKLMSDLNYLHDDMKDQEDIEKAIAVASDIQESYDDLWVNGKLTTDRTKLLNYVTQLEVGLFNINKQEVKAFEDHKDDDRSTASVKKIIDNYRSPYIENTIIEPRVHDHLFKEIMDSIDKLESEQISENIFNGMKLEAISSKLSDNLTDHRGNIVKNLITQDAEIPIKIDEHLKPTPSAEELHAIKDEFSKRSVKLVEENLKTPNKVRRDSGIEISELNLDREDILKTNKGEILDNENNIYKDIKMIKKEENKFSYHSSIRRLRHLFGVKSDYDLNRRSISRTKWEYFLYCHRMVNDIYDLQFKSIYRVDRKKLGILRTFFMDNMSKIILEGKIMKNDCTDTTLLKQLFDCFLHKKEKILVDEPLVKMETIIDHEKRQELFRGFKRHNENKELENDLIRRNNSRKIDVIREMRAELDKAEENYYNADALGKLRRLPRLVMLRTRELPSMEEEHIITDMTLEDLPLEQTTMETAEYRRYKEILDMSTRERHSKGYCEPAVRPRTSEVRETITKWLEDGEINTISKQKFNIDEEGCYAFKEGFELIVECKISLNNLNIYIMNLLMSHLPSGRIRGEIQSSFMENKHRPLSWLISTISYGYISSKFLDMKKTDRNRVVKTLYSILDEDFTGYL